MDRRRFISFMLASAGAATVSPHVLANSKSKSKPNPNPGSSPLILGIFPRRNVRVTYKLFSPLAEYLSQQLGREIILETAKSFNHFWLNVKKGRYDIVHYNQYHYIISHMSFGYDVIAINKELGHDTISGSLIVRKDSGINKVSDLKGKTVLFGGGKRAMQSYISATWLLRQGGLHKGDYVEKFAINPPNTIISTYFNRADASGSGDVVMKLDNVRKRIDISQLKFLAKTKPMAHLPWAVASKLPEELKTTIQEILIKLTDSTEGRYVLKAANLDALISAVDSNFNEHRRIITDVYGNDYGVSILK